MSSVADILEIPEPYVLELQSMRESANEGVIVDDIDGDFNDEFLFWEADGSGICSVTYYDEDIRDLYEEFEIGKGEFTLYTTNWDSQEKKEIVVAHHKDNKVYLRLMSFAGNNIVWPFVAFKGQDNNGDGRWDGCLRPHIDMHINGDSYKDIICTVVSHRDRTPRGVAAYDMWKGELLWEYPTGTQIEKIFSANLDGAGDEEIICTSYAPSTFADKISINETDDSHSYIIALNSEGHQYWKVPIGGTFSGVHAVAGDLNSDDKTEVVFATFSRADLAEAHSSGKRNRISIIDGGTGTSLEKDFMLSSNSSCLLLEDLFKESDGDRKPEIVVGTEGGKILVFDSSLNLLKDKKVSRRIDNIVISDLNGDKKNEIVVTADNPQIEALVLDSNFNVIARYSHGGEPFLLKRSDIQNRLLLRTDTDLKILTLAKNPERSHFISLLIIAGLILLVVLGIFFYLGFKTNQSRFLLSRIREDVADNLAIGFVLLDKKGTILNLNNSALSILDIDKEKFWGVGYDAFLRNEKLKDMHDVIDESLTASPQKAMRREIGLRIDGGRKEVTIEVVPLLDKKSRDLGRLIIIQDITELSHSKRITAWGAMAQRLAHKIKNPLSTMRLALQRMQTVAHQTLNKEAIKFDRYIEANLNEINRLLNMTDGFMKFADLKPPNFQPTDINMLIKGILEKYADASSDKVKLNVNLEKDLPHVRADQEQIETVLDNVMTNALTAMEAQGSFNISTSFVQRFQEELTKTGTREYVRVEISDTGCGIPSSDLDRLFDPFYSRTEGGTGLGLAIVKKIVEDHEGFIQVDSTEGVGTTFAIYIPVK